MKVFKISTVVQRLYCLGCLIVVACMPLYTAYYTTAFGEVCFSMGQFFALLSTFNPMGLIGAIINFIVYFNTELRQSKKAFIWVIASPILIVLCWVLAVSFFVHHSGGV